MKTSNWGNKTALPETRLRHELGAQMHKLWLITWHEDREINPGVPDISYVPRTGSYETGWLELKAIWAPVNGQLKFKIRASQHDWIEAHCRRIPVHFLLAVDDTCYVVSGHFHGRIAEKITIQFLETIAIASFPITDMAPSLVALADRFTKKPS